MLARKGKYFWANKLFCLQKIDSHGIYKKKTSDMLVATPEYRRPHLFYKLCENFSRIKTNRNNEFYHIDHSRMIKDSEILEKSVFE